MSDFSAIVAKAAGLINQAVVNDELPAEAANPFAHSDAQRRTCERFVRKLVQEGKLGAGVQEHQVSEILRWLIGMGPLDPLLADPGVSSIQVMEYDDVWVYKGGSWIKTDVAWESADRYSDYMRALASRSGTSLSLDNRVIQKTFSAPTGRLQIDATAITESRITMHVRLGRRFQITLENMLAAGGMSSEMYAFLSEIAQRDVGVLIMGMPGTGKTTLLEALISLWPMMPAVALDDGSEFQPVHPMCVLYNLPSDQLQDGFIWSLRKNTQRVALAEMRGNEAAAMLKFSGALVIWTTLHGNVDNAVARLMALAQGAPGSPYKDLPERLVRQVIAAAFPVIIETGAVSVGGQTTFYLARIAANQGETTRTLFEAVVEGAQLKGFRRVNAPEDLLGQHQRRSFGALPPASLDHLSALAEVSPVGALMALEQRLRGNPTDEDAKVLLRRLSRAGQDAQDYIKTRVARFKQRSADLNAGRDWAGLRAWYAQIDGDPIVAWMMREVPELERQLKPVPYAEVAARALAVQRAEEILSIDQPGALAALWADVVAQEQAYPAGFRQLVEGRLQGLADREVED